MSVAMGTAQPRAFSVPAQSRAWITAGIAAPPIAAATGSVTFLRSLSSPATSSRLISRPTTKKKIAIRPSLTQYHSG